MYSLPNQPVNTADNYQTFACPRGARFTIQVFGSNPVDVGLGKGFPQPQYVQADVYLAQTTWVDSMEVDEIRFKSHVPGKPGQIAITVFTVDEVGKDKAPGGLFPNYLALNPDGTLDAVFSGIIHASGGDFDGDIFADSLQVLEQPWPGATVPPSDANQIEWRVTKDGDLREGIFGAQRRYLRVSGASVLVGAHWGIRTEDESGAMIETFLQSPRGRRFVAPAGDYVSGSDFDLRISDEYQIGLNIPAASIDTETITTEPLGSFLQVIGYMDQTGGGSFMDWVTWSLTTIAGNDLTFNFVNHAPADPAVGTFVFRLLMAA